MVLNGLIRSYFTQTFQAPIQWKNHQYHFFKPLCNASEAPTRGALKKKLFLKVSQYSQKNACVRVIDYDLQLYLKRDSNTRGFPLNILKFLRTPFLRNICKRLLLNASKMYTMKAVWETICCQLFLQKKQFVRLRTNELIY